MYAINLLSEAENSGGGGYSWLIYVLLAVVLVVMIVMPMFTNRKKQKEVNEMFESLGVGDEIMTIGGIMGKVVELYDHSSGEKLMVIETGDGTKMTFTVQALRLNYTKTKMRQEQLAKEKAEREAAKAAGKHKKDEPENTPESVASEDNTEQTVEEKTEEENK